MISLPLLAILSLLSVAPVAPHGAACDGIDDFILFLNSASDPTEPHFLITGCVNVSGSLLLTVSGVPFPGGQTYLIFDNDGTDPINGIFDGLPEGALVTSGGQTFVVSYRGGSGNDFTLRAVAEPTVPTLAESALMALGALLAVLGVMKIRN